jgi:hypothetical protein
MCGEYSFNVFLLLFMVLRVPTFATLCKRAVLVLWHAYMFLGLKPVGFFPPCSCFLGGFLYLCFNGGHSMSNTFFYKTNGNNKQPRE